MLADGRLGLGHSRLALVDLTSAADQPFEVPLYCLSFHGEIYNFRELREELIKEGYRFRTKSDTEVLLNAFSHWGPSALSRFRGGYAFIIADLRHQRLYVVRDPVGEKHIVYTRGSNGDWVFASEVKGLLAHPFVNCSPNLRQFASDLIFKFFSDREESHFNGISFVPAGHYLWFDLRTGTGPNLVPYWKPEEIIPTEHSPKAISQAVEKIASLLEESVALCQQADCPVGSILSGGIDSSLVTYLGALHNRRDSPLDCFSIKYSYGANRDLQYAKLLTTTVPLNLYEVSIDESMGLNDIDFITHTLEEPMWDKVYFAQYENYRRASKEGLRAVLNGQGADELWLGYLFFYKVFQLAPSELTYEELCKWWLQKNIFTPFMPPSVIRKIVRPCIEMNLTKNFVPFQQLEPLTALSFFSVRTHLQSMLIQEDRLSMANSVEVRLPHVDIRLVECALSIPASVKMFDGKEKYLLRKVSRKWLPLRITNRRKLAFPEPPNAYDRRLDRKIQAAALRGSNILQELFQGSLERALDSLTVRQRWMLFALYRMEKIFFT